MTLIFPAHAMRTLKWPAFSLRMTCAPEMTLILPLARRASSEIAYRRDRLRSGFWRQGLPKGL